MSLYLKARRTQSATDIIYQVIFPKERKGEGDLDALLKGEHTWTIG